MTIQQKERIIKELEKSPDFIFVVTDTLTTSTRVTIETLAYMTKVSQKNKWGLKTFKDEAGKGYIIEKKVTKNNKPMKWRGHPKSKNVEDRRSRKPGRKIVTMESVGAAPKKKKTPLKSTPSTIVPAKKRKSTGLNGPASATKTVKVSKAAGTRADGTLKKGHRYVKGGSIVKVTKK